MMKLACQRCKHKKIKCDRAEGTCHQCVLAQAECIYIERKKRPRLTQQKNDVTALNRRLEFLERQLSRSEREASSSSLPKDDVPLDPSTQSRSSVSPVSPEVLLTVEGNGQASWIHRLASDTKRNFEKVNIQSHQSPADTPASLTVDTAMCALTKALDDLANLRIRDEVRPKRLALKLTPDKARECIKIFMEVIQAMVIPQAFTSGIDLAILNVIPDVIESSMSSYVNIDPCIKVIYYNALYYGLRRIDGPGSELAQAAYCMCLEAVPGWLNTTAGTDLDAQTAALTAWTACNQFDYQLSWQFHCKACQFIKAKGVDRLDARLPKSVDEEDLQHSSRYLYWHCLQTDDLFRILYNKPSALRYKKNEVKPPSLFTASNMQPSATQTILYNVWVRYTAMTREMTDELDKALASNGTEDAMRVADEYCSKLENIIIEWDLETLSKAPKYSKSVALLFADHTMNIYATIIGAKRRARQKNDTPLVDELGLRAARKVINLILYFNTQTPGFGDAGVIFVHFISFYPFCAVFSLYEHILACTDPEQCEADLQLLENIEVAVRAGCEVHPDLYPLSNTITALNAVSRSTQDLRRNGPSPAYQSPPTHSSSASTMPSPATQQHQQPHMKSSSFTPMGQSTQPVTSSRGFNLPMSTLDGLQFQMPPPESSTVGPFGPGVPLLQDFPMGAGDSFEPLGFVRALESDFMAKNWHEPWWDMKCGDIGAGVEGGTGDAEMGGGGGFEGQG
ncbi:hypothetical protein BU24DRAFT_447492 [Aaosphaeria arxii CBS 175.79]|uniref:Zn(2)-C6 fungal-type domain-containing protein n=1 Tax=Aaosphaeria arxii CBS 175.79 TaxID=1450172 RepID=A0A6A5Y2S4_9PLEO|nr:uncharacterized protein BU24DRAFT_447492 [Aaosphaeria arxii CBS 175.79]KAF2018874.1 hypothetical protein BU24DRAFT_447492 [Aaosphaeria arxii CBS 175.79]